MKWTDWTVAHSEGAMGAMRIIMILEISMIERKLGASYQANKKKKKNASFTIQTWMN